MADATLEAVRDAALWFEAGTDGLGPLLDAIGDASLVLIGEASHGTHELEVTSGSFTTSRCHGSWC